jgi:hypothetical protein
MLTLQYAATLMTWLLPGLFLHFLAESEGKLPGEGSPVGAV